MLPEFLFPSAFLPRNWVCDSFFPELFFKKVLFLYAEQWGSIPWANRKTLPGFMTLVMCFQCVTFTVETAECRCMMFFTIIWTKRNSDVENSVHLRSYWVSVICLTLNFEMRGPRPLVPRSLVCRKRCKPLSTESPKCSGYQQKDL